MIAPVPAVEPTTISDQPFVIFPISVASMAYVPAPPANPIVVAAVTVSSVNVPVPVRAALMVGLALLRIARLLAPIVCAPATVIAPVAD